MRKVIVEHTDDHTNVYVVYSYSLDKVPSLEEYLSKVASNLEKEYIDRINKFLETSEALKTYTLGVAIENGVKLEDISTPEYKVVGIQIEPKPMILIEIAPGILVSIPVRNAEKVIDTVLRKIDSIIAEIDKKLEEIEKSLERLKKMGRIDEEFFTIQSKGIRLMNRLGKYVRLRMDLKRLHDEILEELKKLEDVVSEYDRKLREISEQEIRKFVQNLVPREISLDIGNLVLRSVSVYPGTVLITYAGKLRGIISKEELSRILPRDIIKSRKGSLVLIARS